MTRLAFVAALAALGTSAIATEPVGTLKGFTLGTPMDACPPNTVSQQTTRDGTTLCNLGPTTLANQPARDMLVALRDGQLLAVMVQLEARGSSANGAVLDALVARHGAPSRSSDVLNEHRWLSGNAALFLDGRRGTVMLTDVRAGQVNRQRQAEDNKRDL